MLSIISTLAIAFLTSLVLTPVVRAWAPRFRLVDKPDFDRKLHSRPIPLGGGIAILASSLVGVVLISFVPGAEPIRESFGELLPLLIAACIICTLGLADDRHVLRGRQKLAGQIVAVGILIYSGLVIQTVAIFDWEIQLGLLAVPFTLCWMLGAINSLNLLDGADGFATTIGIIISGAISVMALATGHPAEAAIAAALTGALLGFLIFNFPPASIFLGDAGSMLIGLVVGVLAVRGTLKGPATIALATPLAVLAIPFFDSAVAVLRRWLTGRSLYVSDRGHLHHNLSRCGLGPRAIVVVAAVLCTLTAAGALVGVYMKNEPLALITVGAVLAILVVSRVFGFNELMLLASRALAFGNSLLTSSIGGDGLIRQESIRLQGSRNWDELWNTVTDFAEQHNVSYVRLNLNAAWLHEGFHATWRRNSEVTPNAHWRTQMPLLANGRSLGDLEIEGAVTNGAVYPLLSLTAELLETLQPCINRLADELPMHSTVTETRIDVAPPDLRTEQPAARQTVVHSSEIG